MAKLYFKHGTMNSSKTAQLLMTAHNYISQGKDIIALKSARDTRWKIGHIESRALEFELQCNLIKEHESVIELMKELIEDREIHAILVDEAHFLTAKQVGELAYIVDKENIPIICFGLKNSYKNGELFEGSRALLYYADRIDEVKTVCQYCKRKAIMNLRVKNGKPVYSGDIIIIGDTKASDDYFIPVCRKHYFNPLLTIKN